jgi:pyruvate dehydrogenase E2 component (dihydrolipoyllysine-residue acetyltransferase)
MASESLSCLAGQDVSTGLGTENRPAVIELGMASRAVARRLQKSSSTIPHFYLQSSFNAESIQAQRTRAELPRPSWDAFIVRAVGIALKKHSRLCYRFDDKCLRDSGTDRVGIAVDADGDLYVISVESPGDRSPIDISGDIRDQVTRVREGDADARRLYPANLTVTNLGMCGVESFLPIINPPESAILAVGRVCETCVIRGDQVVIENRAALTLAVDHRVVYGRYAGEYLAKVISILEEDTGQQ